MFLSYDKKFNIIDVARYRFAVCIAFNRITQFNSACGKL